jgi:hypothetical protein
VTPMFVGNGLARDERRRPTTSRPMVAMARIACADEKVFD